MHSMWAQLLTISEAESMQESRKQDTGGHLEVQAAQALVKAQTECVWVISTE
jgi:hypothetical protein